MNLRAQHAQFLIIRTLTRCPLSLDLLDRHRHLLADPPAREERNDYYDANGDYLAPFGGCGFVVAGRAENDEDERFGEGKNDCDHVQPEGHACAGEEGVGEICESIVSFDVIRWRWAGITYGVGQCCNE